MFACWLQGRLSVLPNQNLIANIGYGPNATHTIKGSELANIPVEEMHFPLKHPLGVVCNRTLDSRDFKRRWRTQSLKTLIKMELKLFAKKALRNSGLDADR